MYSSLRNLITVFSLFFCSGLLAQNITLTPGTCPSPIVKMGDSVNFVVTVRNPSSGTDRNGAVFKITVPANWKLISTNPSYSSFSENVYSINGLNILKGTETNITVSLQAQCNAVDYDEINYALYASDNSTLLASGKNSDVQEGIISNVLAPFLRFSTTDGIPSLTMDKDVETTREWEIVQGTPSAHVKNMKIEIPCDTANIKLTDVLFKLSDGSTYESFGSRFQKKSTGYTLIIDEYIINKINGTDKLTYGQSISIKEVIVNKTCAVTTLLNYSVYYGDGTSWCLGLTDENSLTVLAISYAPWIEWTTSGSTFSASVGTQANAAYNIFPTGSTGASGKLGKRIYRVANVMEKIDSDPLKGTLRDLRVRFSTNRTYNQANNGYLKVYRAYFSDASGNPIAGVPNIPVYKGIGIPDYSTGSLPNDPSNAVQKSFQYIVCFDSLSTVGFTGNVNVPLIDYDQNGSYDDLPPEEMFYFTVEYDVQYDVGFAYNPAGTTAQNNFLTFHRSMVDLFYRDVCGGYNGFGFVANFQFNESNYPEMLKANDGMLYGASTNIGETVVNVGQPVISSSTQVDGVESYPVFTDNKNIAPGDETVLRIKIPPISSSLSRTGFLVNSLRNNSQSGTNHNSSAAGINYEHTVWVTLPEGFEFDSAYGVKIRANQYETTSGTTSPGTLWNVYTNADYGSVEVVTVGTRQMLKIRNKTYYGNDAWFYIGMKDTNNPLNPDETPRTDKNVDFSFYFNMKDEEPVEYAYFTVPLDYNQIFDCNTIQLSKFSPERTTFGYTDNTMQVMANSSTPGINLQSAGPYDNVSHKAHLKIKSDITLETNEKFIVKLSYQDNETLPYFIFPDDDKVAVLHYLENGESGFVDVVVPLSKLSMQYEEPTRSYFLNLTDYITAGTIGLNSGDSLIVEFLTQATENIPVEATSMTGLEMEAYTQLQGRDPEINTCGSRSANLTLFNYKLASIVGANGIYTFTNGSGELFRWQISNNSSSSEVFVNEFRPNSSFDSITIKLDGLFIIDSLYIYASGANATNSTIGTSTSGWVKLSSEYATISYEEAKTYITINNKRRTENNSSAQKFETEVFSSYSNGIYLYAYVTLIGALAEDFIATADLGPNVTTVGNKAYAVHYPTSEEPLEGIVSNSRANFLPTFQFYKYSLISTLPVSTPIADEAQWNLRLTNLSDNQTGLGGILSNSWISLECGEEVLGDDIAIYEVNAVTQDTILINSPFIKVEEGKYWVKLGDLHIQGDKEFIIKSSFKSCNPGNYKIRARYGMANEIYPDDPWSGYAAYNTSQTLNTTDDVSLSLQVRNVKFKAEAFASNPAEINSEGLYSLCEPFTIDAGFKNLTSETQLSDLEIKILLSEGLEINCAYTPMIKIGNGAFHTSDNLKVNCNDGEGYAIISLPDSVLLDINGSVSDSVVVRFQMLSGCGFNGGSVRMDMRAKKGCGVIVPEAISTSDYFPVIRLDNTPIVIIDDIKINNAQAKNNNADAVEVTYDFANDGEMTMVINYSWEENNSSILYSYIDFPADLDFTGILENLSEGDTYDAVFVEEPTTTIGYKRIKAQFKASSTYNFLTPLTYKATITFTPQTLGAWDCIDYSIYNWLAVTATLRCESENKDCEVYEMLSDSYSYFRYKKLKDMTVRAVGSYESNSEASVTIHGEISSNLLSEEFDFDVVMRLYYEDEDGEYNPVPGVPPYTANITNENLSFNAGPYTIDPNLLCGLALIIHAREDENEYLCEDIIVPLIDKLEYSIINGDTTACQSITPFAIGDPAIAGYTYAWTSDNAANLTYLSSLTTSQPDFTPSVPGTYKYFLTVTFDEGCSARDSVTIVVNPYEKTVIADDICEGTTMNLSPSSGGTWYTNNPAVATISINGVVTAIAPGKVAFMFTDSTTHCSVISDTISVETHSPVNEITGPDYVCVNQYMNLSNATTGGVWDTSDASVATINDLSANPAIIVGVSEGAVIISYTVGSVCKTTVTHSVDVMPITPPEILIGFE